MIDDNSFAVDLLVVDHEFLSANILLGRDVLCGKGKRLIIEDDDCRLEKLNSIRVSEELAPSERDQLKQSLLRHRGWIAENTSDLGKCNVAKVLLRY